MQAGQMLLLSIQGMANMPSNDTRAELRIAGCTLAVDMSTPTPSIETSCDITFNGVSVASLQAEVDVLKSQMAQVLRTVAHITPPSPPPSPPPPPPPPPPPTLSPPPNTQTCAALAPCLWQHLPDTRTQNTAPYWSSFSDVTYISAKYEGVFRSPTDDNSAQADECFYGDRTGSSVTYTSPNWKPHVPIDRLHNWYSDLGSVSPGDASCNVVPATLKCCLNTDAVRAAAMDDFAYPFVVRDPSPWAMITLWKSLNDNFLGWGINSMAEARAKVDAFFDGGGYTGAQTGGSPIAVLASSLAVLDSTLTTTDPPEPFLMYGHFGTYCGSYCQAIGPGPTYAEMVPQQTQGMYPGTMYGLLANFGPMGNSGAIPERTDAWMGHHNPNMPGADKFWIVKLMKTGNVGERKIIEARPYTHGVPWV
jgi:hypothetical protein